MRTAEEIINDFEAEYYAGEVYGDFAFPHKIVVEIVNKARKEAIEECAEIAKGTLTKNEWIDTGLSDDFEKLIDELK